MISNEGTRKESEQVVEGWLRDAFAIAGVQSPALDRAEQSHRAQRRRIGKGAELVVPQRDVGGEIVRPIRPPLADECSELARTILIGRAEKGLVPGPKILGLILHRGGETVPPACPRHFPPPRAPPPEDAIERRRAQPPSVGAVQ